MSDNVIYANHETKLQNLWQKYRLLLFTVIAPTFLAIIYFGFIAADIYISESQFVVRSPQKQSASPLGLFFQSAGFSRSQDDSYTVQNVITSRDALRELEKHLNIRHSFSKGDFVSRFPGLDFDNSFENMHRYYLKRVSAQLDNSSSIITLTVRAFDPQDAQKINKILLDMSERLVNQMNERGQRDMIRFASNEVAAAEEKAKQAGLALAHYRNQRGVIDPERQSAISLQQIAKLQEELISVRTQLAQLQALAADNPQIPIYQKRISVLESEIAKATQGMAGGDRSLASKAAEFQRLSLEREFADRQLASALISLEGARNEAQRQHLYLEKIAQPSLADNAMEPRRLRSIIAVFLIGLVSWGVLSMLIAGIKEHQD